MRTIKAQKVGRTYLKILLERYNKGETLAVLAEEAGISSPGLSQRFKRSGFDMRSDKHITKKNCSLANGRSIIDVLVSPEQIKRMMAGR